jgi:hypothetical protein
MVNMTEAWRGLEINNYRYIYQLTAESMIINTISTIWDIPH